MITIFISLTPLPPIYTARCDIYFSWLFEPGKMQPLILQPFIEKAIWHRILPKDGGKVKVSVRKNDKYIQCAIEDDGVGRESSLHNKSQISATYQSKGMKLVQGRLSLHHSINNRGTIELIDKKDDHGNGTGTLVIVKFKKDA